MAYGDSFEATEQAAAEHYWGIDKNVIVSRDLVPVVNHSPSLDTDLGGQFVFRYTGPEWGEGDKILDPNRKVDVGGRDWDDLRLVTDISGKRRLHTLAEHVAHAYDHGKVFQIGEWKAQPKMTREDVAENVGRAYDAYNHPRVMMTLTQYGDWLGRVKAAKARDFFTILLPRGQRPVDFDTRVRPYVDRLWGTAWGPL